MNAVAARAFDSESQDSDAILGALLTNLKDKPMQLIVLILLTLVAVVGVPRAATAQPTPPPTCFEVPAIVDCVLIPEFDQFWNGNGGLPVFGYPVSPDTWEFNQDAGDSFGTQWFERNRFELHPENAAPYNVLLGRLGAELLALQGRGFEAPSAANPTGRCRNFNVGGREQRVCDPFLRYWESHGLEFDGRSGTSEGESLALFGLPLTAPKMETNPNGDTVQTQWFERARFEDHGANGVLLGLLGLETLRTPVPGKPVMPIVDGDTGFLLGGSRGGVWVGPSVAAAQLNGGETYRLYTLAGTAGQATGERATRYIGDPCSWVQWVTLKPEPTRGAVGVVGSWNARPRASVDLGTQSEVYRDAVAEILRSNGIPNPEVRLTRVLRVDLEGDGVDEVVLTATRLVDGASSPQVAAGDYSIALIRKVVNGQVQTTMLAESYFLKADTFIAPSEYTLANLVDLNGDGRLEVIVRWQYYEGNGMVVHEVVGDRVRAVLEEGCGV